MEGWTESNKIKESFFTIISLVWNVKIKSIESFVPQTLFFVFRKLVSSPTVHCQIALKMFISGGLIVNKSCMKERNSKKVLERKQELEIQSNCNFCWHDPRSQDLGKYFKYSDFSPAFEALYLCNNEK